MKTITEIRACLADVRTSLEEQIESDPDVNEARAEHYIECFRMADYLLQEEEPLKVRRFKARCACGETVYPHEKYCPKCGRKLEWVD